MKDDRARRTWHGRCGGAALVALAFVLAACGGQPSPTVGDGPVDGSADDAVAVLADRACPDVFATRVYDPPPEEQPPIDPAITQAELFDDVAVTDDGDGEDPVESGMDAMSAAREWAQREAPEHFAGTWLDNDQQAAVIAFTEDVDGYAEQIRPRFGAGWWVVRGEHAYAELERVHEEVVRTEMGGGSDGPLTPLGTVTSSGLRDDVQRVSVGVVGGDDEALAALGDRLDHPAICFEVEAPPPEPDGPVRTLATAEGWRTEFGLGVDERLEVAYDQATGERAFADNVPDDLPAGDGDPWRDALHADLGTVDWDREVVVVWHGGRSGSCPAWVTDVRVEDDAVRVERASPSAGACTTDFNAYRAVLAVPRDAVPPADALPLPLNPPDVVSGLDDPDRPTHEAVVYPSS